MKLKKSSRPNKPACSKWKINVEDRYSSGCDDKVEEVSKEDEFFLVSFRLIEIPKTDSTVEEIF